MEAKFTDVTFVITEKDEELMMRVPMFRWHSDSVFPTESYGKFQLPDLYTALGHPLAGSYDW